MNAPNPNLINFFAKTNFRNRQVPFGIKVDDRRRHMYVIGKTGMGKTTMLENMVIQDIRNGNGVCFIDPHGDSIGKILDFVPNDRINDVVYFNPADLDHPIAFNILESVDTKYKHLVASGLMGVFTKIWANMWSARMEYILSNTILALLESPGNTMLGIVRMYVDKKYRKKIVDNVRDPMVKAFWVEEFANYAEKYRTEAVAPIQNKVGQFLSSSIIRNIVGQPKSTLDLREIMDNRKILLMDLSKGKVGEDNSALLGAMIITKLQLAALSRVDVPEAERKDFYLYVDEFQNFVTDSFATILSEARKYRLNLTMGHQYIGQLTPDNNNKVRDAVFGNVGSMVVFRVGAADAEFLETEFEPHFTPTDIVNLPKWNVILKLMINGVSSNPFTAQTIPANDAWFTGNGQKVIKVSQERYANPSADVEEKISRWMGAEFHESAAIAASGNADETTTPERKFEPRPQPKFIPERSSNAPVSMSSNSITNNGNYNAATTQNSKPTPGNIQIKPASYTNNTSQTTVKKSESTLNNEVATSYGKPLQVDPKTISTDSQIIAGKKDYNDNGKSSPASAKVLQPSESFSYKATTPERPETISQNNSGQKNQLSTRGTGIKVSAEFMERMNRPQQKASEYKPAVASNEMKQNSQNTQKAVFSKSNVVHQPNNASLTKLPQNANETPKQTLPQPKPISQQYGKNQKNIQQLKPKPNNFNTDKKNFAKKENPIWETASSMGHEKSDLLAKNVTNAVEDVFKKPAAKIADKNLQQETTHKASTHTMKPGEVHTF